MKTNDGHDFVLGDPLWVVQYGYKDDYFLDSTRYRVSTAGGTLPTPDWVIADDGLMYYLPHCFSTEAAAVKSQIMDVRRHLEMARARLDTLEDERRLAARK